MNKLEAVAVPFTVLHVCLGNICRSPLAERLLELRVKQAFGAGAANLVRSVSAGTGDWHLGEEIYTSSAEQLRLLGARTTDFTSSLITSAEIQAADLILAAGPEHVKEVVRLVPTAAERTFVLRHFGRLMALIEPSSLPPGRDAAAIASRGRQLVAAAGAVARREPATDADDLTDPWGMNEAAFAQVASHIDAAITPFVDLLAAG